MFENLAITEFTIFEDDDGSHYINQYVGGCRDTVAVGMTRREAARMRIRLNRMARLAREVSRTEAYQRHHGAYERLREATQCPR